VTDRNTAQPKGTHGIALRVGRIAGIEVYLDLSAVVIVALIAWVMASALPELESGYSSTAYWVVGCAGALLFVAALLAHELSHSVVARHRGIAVRDITLWMLGGIATIERDPASANDELAVAVAGPAASLGIGAGSLVAGAAGSMLGLSPLIVAALVWLGTMNVFLALFNLVPAAPLDGGRVLAAFLWRRSGDRLGATRSAAHAGRVFAWCLFGLGTLELLSGGGVSGVWAVLLGWFVLGAATAEEARAVVEQGLAGVRIRDIMTPDPVVAPDSITVDELLDRFVMAHRCTSFPITSNGSVTGLATLARCRAVDPHRRAGTSVRDVAWPVSQVAVARADELVVEVLHRGTGGGDGRILVFDEDRLVGIVSPSDLARVTASVH
jgi:Zn-dependent protease